MWSTKAVHSEGLQWVSNRADRSDTTALDHKAPWGRDGLCCVGKLALLGNLMFAWIDFEHFLGKSVLQYKTSRYIEDFLVLLVFF